MTMMKGKGYVSDDGRDDGLGSEEEGQQEEMHRSSGGDFIMPKRWSFRQARRRKRWRETLNAAHVTPV